MKNRYFGDNKDLFKFDLISKLTRRLNLSFVYIPMLTPPSEKGGNDRVRQHAVGKNNPELLDFLNSYEDEDKRDVRHIKRFFGKYKIHTEIYKGNKCLPDKLRAEYFAGIEREWLSEALIFLDPDNGFEVEKSNEKHVLYCEIKALYNSMRDNSLLQVIQFFPRYKNQSHEEYLEKRLTEIKKYVGCAKPAFISDNKIAFFLISRNSIIRKEVNKIITNYRSNYINDKRIYKKLRISAV